MEAIGTHQFWGMSPACDLQQVYRTVWGAGDDEDKALNILLVQPGDPRHVLKTIASRHRHSKRPLHFFIHERNPEVLARHLLLLSIATDWELPVRQRAAVWLEVFGNALLQARTARYVSSKRGGLIDLVCNGRGPEPLATVLDTSLLKHRQRDDVEEAAQGYAEGAPFDMAGLRDQRMRHHYGARFDFRDNLIDWDYTSGARTYNGGIHSRQFRGWRNTGVAFELGDQVYTAPNRSLASYAEGRERGRSTLRRGFWGDIVASPYHALAGAAYVPTDAEADAALLASSLAGDAAGGAAAAAAPASGGGSFGYQLFDIMSRLSGSEQHRHHAVELATYNALAWLWEMETARLYVMREEHDVYSGLEGGSGLGGAGQGDDRAAADDKAGGAAASPPASTDADADAALSATAAAAAAAAASATTAAASAASSAAAAASAATAAATAARTRARVISRAFSGVRITLLGGEPDEWLVRGRLGPATPLHVVCLSGRAVHLLDTARRATAAAVPFAGLGASPAAPEAGAAAPPSAAALLAGLAAPEGCVVVAETARNIPTLTAAQTLEFTRRVLSMGARLGAVVVGSDRELSADTYAVGTVISVGKPPPRPPTHVEPPAGGGPGRLPLRFFAPEYGGSLAAPAGGAGGASSEPKAAAARAKRVKTAGTAEMSHSLAAHAAVAGLREAFAGGGGDAGEERGAGAAHAAAERSVGYAHGLPWHDCASGDNPLPEAVVFGLLPGRAAARVAEASATLLERFPLGTPAPPPGAP